MEGEPVLAPEIIERIRRERDERERPALQIPLPCPEMDPRMRDEEERTEPRRVIEIDLL